MVHIRPLERVKQVQRRVPEHVVAVLLPLFLQRERADDDFSSA